MYQSLTKKISHIFSNLTGKISAQDIDAALGEIEKALIDADVSQQAIQSFKQKIQAENIDLEKVKNLDARSHLMSIVRKALIELLSHNEPLPSFSHSLTVIMLVGLQGAGKTTSCGKIAHWIKSTYPKKQVMMTSVDIYRPKAIEQLKVLANQTHSTFHPHHEGLTPLEICKNAIDHAKRSTTDVLIIDTAGRLDIDQERMQEIQAINKNIKPHHVWYTVDSMMGQSALNTAKAFNDTVDISGVILSKIDSDTKGGVALSVKSVIQKPIFWMGTGEDLAKLEAFDPERIADQLLDMGDIVGLAKKAHKHLDTQKTEKLSKRLSKGLFTLDDMLTQMQQISQMGGLSSILKLLPGAAKLPDHMMKMVEDDTKLKVFESLIQSMTPLERQRPDLIKNQKRRQVRVLQGSGRKKPDINELLKAYEKMKKMTDKMKGGKMKALMQQFAQSGDFDRFSS